MLSIHCWFCSYRFTSLREQKLSLQSEKIQRFVTPDWNKNDFTSRFPGVLFNTAGILSFSFFFYSWYSCLFIAYVLVFFLSPLCSFYVCRHIQRAIHEFYSFLQNLRLFFPKNQLAMQVPTFSWLKPTMLIDWIQNSVYNNVWTTKSDLSLIR